MRNPIQILSLQEKEETQKRIKQMSYFALEKMPNSNSTTILMSLKTLTYKDSIITLILILQATTTIRSPSNTHNHLKNNSLPKTTTFTMEFSPDTHW